MQNKLKMNWVESQDLASLFSLLISLIGLLIKQITLLR